MLRYMTAGESHGKAEISIVDGVPAGLKLDTAFIDNELKRRQHGYGRGGRMDIETDKVDVVAGCRKGVTIGSPVGMLVNNTDYKIDELPEVKSPRPGHADLAGIIKYGLKDARDVLERASARESVSRVTCGAVARLILAEFDIRLVSHVTMIGSVRSKAEGLSFDDIVRLTDMKDSRLRCADKEAEDLMCAEIDSAGRKGDTLGGIFEVIAEKVPPGLGSYTQWDKRLDSAIAAAVMAIPAVKAVSIGQGIECAGMKGSQVHDPIAYDKKSKSFTRSSNNAGGFEGGVTNGEYVVVRGFMKPIATLKDPLNSVNIDSKKNEMASTERSDVCAVPACGVIAEAVVGFELASAFLDKFGCDSIAEIRRNYEAYLKHIKTI